MADRLNALLARVAEGETPEDRDEAWNEIVADHDRLREKIETVRHCSSTATSTATSYDQESQ